ncbi:tetratricopeptide repeat protein [Leptospira fainei serovar Hurstbridge str. BUT 6]|uniref:Tetratricopeptide repeat protein n=2 Tax=Leptospira fainei serovar Hurstbridge str. BUT 6 TaxID=1193011 RepID=S3V1N8_9LEPT|nr:tetratricopeptide repeat protein [Leptospira fainei]EPG75353.1 tetratricopeptide repeat protein [Leptospira fainei serovar Hurstbridge str. BUT 6]
MRDNYKQALAQFQSKHLNESKSSFERLYKDNPDYLLVRLMLAKTYFFSNNLKVAAKLFEEDYSKNPARIESAIWMYRTKYILGEDPKAIVMGLDKIIIEDPNNIEAWILRGRIYEKLGQLDYAIESYRNVVKNDERLGFAHFRLSELLHGFAPKQSDVDLIKAKALGYNPELEKMQIDSDATTKAKHER